MKPSTTLQRTFRHITLLESLLFKINSRRMVKAEDLQVELLSCQKKKSKSQCNFWVRKTVMSIVLHMILWSRLRTYILGLHCYSVVSMACSKLEEANQSTMSDPRDLYRQSQSPAALLAGFYHLYLPVFKAVIRTIRNVLSQEQRTHLLL